MRDLSGSEPEVSLAVMLSTAAEEDDESSEEDSAVDDFLASHGFEFIDATSTATDQVEEQDDNNYSDGELV